jgi:hypothetical protein
MKKYTAAFTSVLILALAGAAVHSARAQSAPVIPAWIHPGLAVIYDGDAAYVKNGILSPGATVAVTTQVNSVKGNEVFGVTTIQVAGSPAGQKHTWTCSAAERCTSDMPGFSGMFWVDPANPTASIKGPNGEPYSMRGNAPYTRNGMTWAATTISYQNQSTQVQYMCIFETKTGLYLAYSESSPGGQVHTYFRSMSGQ